MKHLLSFILFCHVLHLYGQQDKLSFTGKVKFISDAPLELIQAQSSGLIGIIQPEAKKFAFSVRLSTLEGFNSTLQKEHFNENYLESVKYPYATYSGKLLDELNVNTPGKFQIRSKGIFSIHGISNERILNQTITIKDGWITVESKFTILLEDYNISIPRIVYKKIAEEIQVSIEAKAKI